MLEMPGTNAFLASDYSACGAPQILSEWIPERHRLLLPQAPLPDGLDDVRDALIVKGELLVLRSFGNAIGCCKGRQES
jgi:hypothetical protein